ncbi:DNA repair protein XRCC2 homolog isoform X2 [Juglans microcarpa x Juglans regia]|uniref:DNA repair protein XRCC2 homolog isoform X2 n=1 Tax=Juglans microcarpa x Juglans regia TaxID=2249226 RepID=UPI001B7F0174|nr:DNA repair protein XRCC2 homolog isoform X2 [Juglans microcarpa x Juglans regia]
MEKVVGSPREWIDRNESAKTMLARVLTARPLLLLPPLHRVPLRVGNVVELVGTSPSAKTHILIQAAVSCVLPKEWNGVHYGGLDRLVMFIDLDCRFDILRLSKMLKHRINGESNGSLKKIDQEHMDFDLWNNDTKKSPTYDEELYSLCMRRFLFIRCYDSFQFLATLKTLHYRIRKEQELHGISVHILMIDSIGAFHWIDRASTFMPLGATNRKTPSLQTVSETVVQEIRKLLLLHPMLVIATKATIFGDRYSMETKRNLGKLDTSNSRSMSSTSLQLPYREYMPSVWQTFVTHRVLVGASDDPLIRTNDDDCSLYFSEWLLPPQSFVDKFTVKEAGVFMVP